MRIGLFTDTYYPEINGVATSTQQLKKGLEALGHQVYVFAPSNPQKYTEEINVVREKSVAFLLYKDRRASVFSIKNAVKEIKELKLDIIHSQTEFTLGHLAKKCAEEFNLPRVHTYHTVYEDYTHCLKFPGCNSELVKNMVRRISKMICSKADTIVVPTAKVKELLISYGVTNKIFVQPTGIDHKKFSSPDMDTVKKLKLKYNISSQNKILVFAGRMSREKNVGELIEYLPEIISKQPDTKLVIVGDGPERANIQWAVKKLSLEDNVIFTGIVPWSEIENYYALGDIFVCGSTSETQGLTYIEALASGKPLLVRYDDCLRNVLFQNKNGIGYTNKKEFAQGYFEICQNYDDMVKEGLKTACKYSNITFAENMLKIYKELILV